MRGDPTSPFWGRSALGFLWREWCWSWNSSTLATSCEELTHWKRLWCWEGLGAGGEGDNRGWDGWMSSLTRWSWVWVNSGSWWWTGGLACCDSWGRKESDTTERLNWTELNWGHLNLFHSSVMLFVCSESLKRDKSHCIASIALSSDSLNFSSGMFNFPLIPSSVFFMSDIIIFISINSG